jgi:hypothetical protein
MDEGGLVRGKGEAYFDIKRRRRLIYAKSPSRR